MGVTLSKFHEKLKTEAEYEKVTSSLANSRDPKCLQLLPAALAVTFGSTYSYFWQHLQLLPAVTVVYNIYGYILFESSVPIIQ